MRISVNGQERELADGLSVEGLLRLLEIEPARVAVEVNEEIVRKATYAARLLQPGDRIEVVSFMGGGAAGCGTVQPTEGARQ